MIQLSDAAIAMHPLMSQLKTPPTHAKLVSHHYVRDLSNVKLGHAMVANVIHAVYALGSVDGSGNFTPSSIVESFTTAVDMSPPPVASTIPNAGSGTLDGINPAQRYAAAMNLVGAGKAPTAGQPHVSVNVPSKKAGDFKEADLDAVISFFNKRLEGTVV